MGRLLRKCTFEPRLCTEQADEALHALGVDLEDIHEQEHDAGLGNGGLGQVGSLFPG